MTSSAPRTPVAVVWTIIGIGAAAAVAARLLSSWALGDTPHVMDELTYYLQARTYLSGHLTAPEHLPRAAFNLWFVEDHGRTFGVFPPGWPLLLAVGLWLKCQLWVNPLLHGGATALVGRAGTRIAGPRLGIIAALLYAASGQALILAASAMSHTLIAFLAAVVLNACVEMMTAGPAMWWLMGGGALGLATMTRPLCAVALAAQVLLVFLARVFRERRLSLLNFTCLSLPPLAGVSFILWYNRRLTGSPWWFPQTEYFDTHLPPVDRPSYTFGPGCNALGFGHACAFVGKHGVHDLSNAIHNTAANLRAWFDLAGAGPLLPVLVFAGLWFAVRGQRVALSLFAIVPLVIVLYGLYWHGGTCYGARYYHAALPALLLTVALGISGVVDVIRAPRWRTYALASSVLLCLALDLRTIARVSDELTPSYFGVDDRFVRLAREWTRPPALVLVAFREDPHPHTESYPMTTGGLMLDFGWIGAVRVLGALGANTPDSSGPVVFAKYHPGLVQPLRERFPKRALWLYIIEPEGTDTLVPYEQSGLTADTVGAKPPADNFGVYWLPPG